MIRRKEPITQAKRLQDLSKTNGMKTFTNEIRIVVGDEWSAGNSVISFKVYDLFGLTI